MLGLAAPASQGLILGIWETLGKRGAIGGDVRGFQRVVDFCHVVRVLELHAFQDEQKDFQRERHVGRCRRHYSLISLQLVVGWLVEVPGIELVIQPLALLDVMDDVVHSQVQRQVDDEKSGHDG